MSWDNLITTNQSEDVMAQFRGTIQGSRGEASRLGGKASGLHVTADGWNIGIEVRLFHLDGKDQIKIALTGGSNGYGQYKELGRFVEGEV